jgi:hypothetical protein
MTKDELKELARKLSREQLIYVISTIIDFEELKLASHNLIKFADKPDRTEISKTGDRGQERADNQYKGN